MRLDVFLRRIIERLRRAHPCGGGGQRQLARIGRKHPRAVIGIGARQLSVHIHVRQLVLDRLIGTDQAAEGITLHRVILRHRKAAIRSADLFERRHDRGTVQDIRRMAPTFARFAQHFGTRPVERDLRMLARGIDGIFRAALHARAFQIDDRQRGAALARFIARTRQHDGEIGIHAVHHRDLLARKLAALERGAHRFRRHCAGAFGTRKGADQFAAGDPGQIFFLLLIGSRREDRFGEKIHRRRKRHRRQRAAEFFRDHAQFEIAEAEPAEFFRDRGAVPTHLGDLLPQILVVAVAAFENLAHGFGRAFLAQEFARLIAQHFLIVGEIEIHRPTLLVSRFRTSPRRCYFPLW